MKSNPLKLIKRDIEFLFEIGSLRNVDRTWKQFGLNAANVSEHIFRVAWIALILARYEKRADSEKILKMALLHDVTETRTGDVNYISRQYTKRDDLKAIGDTVRGSTMENELNAIIQEYEERQSLESRIVKDADILDQEFELKEHRAAGHHLPDKWSARRKRLIDLFFTKSAKIFWKKIHDADPNDWHRLSPGNRFQSGDWKKK